MLKWHRNVRHPLSYHISIICLECKERLIAKAAALAEDVKRIESSASSKDSLILAAEAAAKTGRELAEEMKAASASLGSDLQEAQASKLRLNLMLQVCSRCPCWVQPRW